MQTLRLLMIGAASWPSLAVALPPADLATSQLCTTAIAGAERASAAPEGLMHAIGAMESGRRDPAGRLVAWPWTINAEGVGSYFASKGEAIAAVLALQAQGVRSIDVGCMQVNLMHHSLAFASLNDAFDPAINARYAGSFLQRLLGQTGSWPAATAGYHSLTPELGEPYARKVMSIWRGLPTDQTAPVAVAATMGRSLLPVSAGNGMGLGSPAARIIHQAEPSAASTTIVLAGNGTVGRGLDAYRAAPVRLATRFISTPLRIRS